MSLANGHRNGNGYLDGAAAPRPRILPLPDDRLPPQNIEAEQGVLGGLLLDWGLMHEVADILKPEDFYRDTHAVVYRAMLALHALGRRCDSYVLADALELAGALESAGGLEAIGDLMAAVPHEANTAYHARIVREKAILRRAVEQANRTLRDAYSNLKTAQEVASEATVAFDAIGRATEPGRSVPLAEAVDGAMGLIEARLAGEAHGVATGLPDLDSILGGGLGDGRLVLVGARPAQGKTALCLTIAAHAAIDAGVSTLYFSLEMGALELGERLLSARSGVFGYKLREPSALAPRDREALAAAAGAIRLGRLEIDDRPDRTLLDILSVARRRHATGAVGLIVVDYVQLIRGTGGDDRGKPRHEVVGDISAGLKGLARSLGVPVLVACQLNREVEKAGDRRPRMAHVKESGSLEEDADQVVLIHRPSYYDPNDRPGEADLIVDKNRHGETRKVRVKFNGPLSRFEPFVDFIPPGAYPGHNGEPFA